MFFNRSNCEVLPLYTRLNHITCHQLQPLVEVLAKLGVWPVQVADERLQCLQLPEEILRSCTAIAEIINVKFHPHPNFNSNSWSFA